MNNYEEFMLIFLEVGSFMLLWNRFNKKYENRLYKSALIVLFTSLVALITNYIYSPLQFFVNYIFLFIDIKVTFKKNIKHLLLEFGMLIVIVCIMQLAIIIMIRVSIQAFMVKDDFIYLFIANLICMVLCFCIYKYVTYEKLKIFLEQKSSKIYFFSVNLLMYIVIAKWTWNFKRHEF